ncbi:hypothetical protein GCK72_020158 [Caenorhabditis remanei]|uniref:Uncharacterized protein n=1 Tax=Caenorhabditis remanei TaxID=31234 RepID=A0A6A5GG99_CAERE|nr:hypothetical protein GCK72_020158 [Caenorhabditis remanei]KAF1753601.1 hypothetical protein GCK72_020158 [Caenorhabditis remanei]
MHVPPLLDLCIRRVMPCIFADTLPPTSCQLNPDLSNRLFEEYCNIFDVKMTRRIVKDICALLNVTKVDCSSWGHNRKELIILRNMNLVSLVLGSLTHLGPNKTDSHEPLKLDAMLKFCLNKTTLQQLRHLDLSTTKRKYLDGWVESISKLLPSLISFSVRDRQLSPLEFGPICSNFPNLRSLDISDTGLTSLEGISNLSNIEILAIGGLRDLSWQNMIEIFELKKIRVLNLSSKHKFSRINMFERFLLCDKVLPELRSIDLSGTFVEIHLLELLLKTHPTIEQIEILSSSRQYPPEAFHDVQILSCQNLTVSTQLLKDYASLKNFCSIYHVLIWTNKLMDKRFDIENEIAIRDWFRAIRETIEKFPISANIHLLGLKCLQQISRKERISKFSLADRHELVNILFAICDVRIDYKECKIEARMIEGVWEILKNRHFLSTTHLNIQRIYENALEYCLIEKAGIIQNVCMKIMKYTFKIMKPEDQKEMFGNLGICRDLVESLNFFYRTKQFKKYQFVLKFIIKMVEYHPENFVKAGGVSICVRHLIRYSQVESLKMLKVLALTGNSEFIRELSTPENVRCFVRYLQKCKPKLNYFTNVNSLSEKTFLVCCILSVIVYSIDEKRFNSIYWKNIVKLLKEVLTTLAEEPRYPCVHLEEVFETYFEKRTKDVKQGPIQDIQCHRDEKGACFYC